MELMLGDIRVPFLTYPATMPTRPERPIMVRDRPLPKVLDLTLRSLHGKGTQPSAWQILAET